MAFRRSLPVLTSLFLLLPASGLRAADSLTPAEAKRRESVEHYLRAKLHAADSEFEDSMKEFRKAIELDPKDGNLRREFAEVLRDLSINGDAEIQARKAVELAPESPGAHRVLGQVLLATAKDPASVQAAAEHLRISNDAMPGDPIGAVAYGQALLRLDKASDAAVVLERVLERGRGSAIPLLYGEALEKSGQSGPAEELYQALLHQEPENRAAGIGLLRVYERSRQFDKAIPIVESFLKAQPGNLGVKTEYGATLLRARRFPEAAKVLQEVFKADPGNRDALRQFGTLLSETREIDKADDVFRKLQELEPDDPDIPFRRALNFLDARRLPEAEKLLTTLRAQLVLKKRGDAELAQVDGQLGFIAFLRKDYDAARTRITPHLFEEDSVNPQAFNLLLQIARDKEDWAEGLRIAREAAGKTKKGPGVRAALGEFLLRSSSKADQAEGDETLTALAKESREGTLAAADAWQRLDRFDRAAATARTALETFKEDPDLLFRLAASLERDKKIGESVAAFEQLLAVRGDHAAGLNYLGYLWADRGENLPKALHLIQRAVELDPSNGAYLDSLGWVYYQMNQLEKAEEFLREASELNPDDSAIEEHLGDLFEKRGDLGRARASWKRAQSLKPEDGGKRLEEKLRRTEGRADAARK